MRYLLVAFWVLVFTAVSAHAQVSVGIAVPGISIGINVPVYPSLVRVPGYPVYYDPRARSNYFFYDGVYWVFQADNWYASSWYNGPWQAVGPAYVPLYLLRVPVRYYRQPPVYFQAWGADAPPRWGEHWGPEWEQGRSGWDRWDRRSVPPPAPLPRYQKQYSGSRYPGAVEQQRSIESRNYRYQPREPVTRQYYQQRGTPGSAGPGPQQQRSSPDHQQSQPDVRRPPPQGAPQRPAEPAQQERPRSSEQNAQPQRGDAQDHGRGQGASPQGKGREQGPPPQGKGQQNKDEGRGKD